MNEKKAERRDKKIFQKKNGHKKSGRSVFLIVQIQVKKAKEIKENK